MIDVILIHGIAKTVDSNYYNSFVEGIRRELPIDADVVFHPIDYSPLLERRENIIFFWMRNMHWQRARRFACDFICDILAYRYPKREPCEGDFVCDVHNLIGEKLSKVRKGSKLVFLGHSLGSIISYEMTWNIQTDCLITMGSPFCYFSVAYKNFGELNPSLRQFHNFWRGRDPVSTIISKNPSFRAVHDYEVKSWNPRYLFMLQSHSVYWKSSYVHKKIAEILRGLT